MQRVLRDIDVATIHHRSPDEHLGRAVQAEDKARVFSEFIYYSEEKSPFFF